MKHLIDKDALVVEIKKRISLFQKEKKTEKWSEGASQMNVVSLGARIAMLEEIKVFLNTIEVIEVDEKYERPAIKVTDDVSVASRMTHIDDNLKPIAEFILDYASWNLHKDEWNHPVLVVPLFRVLDALITKGKPYCGQ